VTDNSLRELIRQAYEVKDYQIVAPGWMAEEKYQIAATMPEGTNRTQVPEMLRTLLAQRFHLKLHRETRDLPVYALVAAKGGPHLTPTAYPRNPMPQSSSVPGRVRGIAAPVATLADALTKAAGYTVVDMSGITGLYDFDLKYAEPDAAAPDAAQATMTLESVLREQAGLRLEKRVMPVEILVIEQADKVPTEN
jgi:uncharacterized protein (TIGR03435 family)